MVNADNDTGVLYGGGVPFSMPSPFNGNTTANLGGSSNLIFNSSNGYDSRIINGTSIFNIKSITCKYNTVGTQTNINNVSYNVFINSGVTWLYKNQIQGIGWIYNFNTLYTKDINLYLLAGTSYTNYITKTAWSLNFTDQITMDCFYNWILYINGLPLISSGSGSSNSWTTNTNANEFLAVQNYGLAIFSFILAFLCFALPLFLWYKTSKYFLQNKLNFLFTNIKKNDK